MEVGKRAALYLTCMGCIQRRNEVIGFLRTKPTHNVIYFPGDVQQKDKEMNNEWSEFSLEKTGDYLSKKWSSANIWIFRPARFSPESGQSHYDHLQQSGYGLLHLRAIFLDALSQSSRLSDENLPLILVAFSKGGIVLNHIISELSTFTLSTAYIPDWEDVEYSKSLPFYEPAQRIARQKTRTSTLLEHEKDVKDLFNKVEEMYWVDSHRFPTNEKVIEGFKNYVDKEQKNLKLMIYGTPRQLNDKNRPFIRKEHDCFLDILKKNNTDKLEIFSQTFFEKEKPSMYNHFKILTCF